jgi:hypothetical protein
MRLNANFGMNNMVSLLLLRIRQRRRSTGRLFCTAACTSVAVVFRRFLASVHNASLVQRFQLDNVKERYAAERVSLRRR